MAGVDDRRRSRAKIDSPDLAGDELATLAEAGQARVGQARLVGEPATTAARVAQRADDDSGQHGRVDRMAHGVGHREVQRVALDREVERVARDVAGRLQPGGERELRCLTRV